LPIFQLSTLPEFLSSATQNHIFGDLKYFFGSFFGSKALALKPLHSEEANLSVLGRGSHSVGFQEGKIFLWGSSVTGQIESVALELAIEFQLRFREILEI